MNSHWRLPLDNLMKLDTVSAQIKGHSQLDRHFDIILIKCHFFAPKVPFLGLFEAKIGKIQIHCHWKNLKFL